MKPMAKAGLAFIAIGAAILLLAGFTWRPQKLIVTGGFGISNADFELQMNDRIFVAIVGGALLICGTILFAVASIHSDR